MHKRIKNNSGITLVALVIAIIVLLILASVVIRLAVGDNGVIIRAKDSANKYNQAQDYEIGIMDDISKEYDSIISGNWMGGDSGNNPRNKSTVEIQQRQAVMIIQICHQVEAVI